MLGMMCSMLHGLGSREVVLRWMLSQGRGAVSLLRTGMQYR
jgi:hypothetical protein